MSSHARFWKTGFLAVALAAPIVGCHRNVNAAMQEQAPNPADANMVPIQGNGQQNEAVTQAATYQNGQPTASTYPAPATSSQNQAYGSPRPAYQPNGQYRQPNDQYAQDPNGQYAQDPNAQYADDQADLGGEALDEAMADTPPPPLPDYEQPEAPGPDYIWTPGYWDYAPVGYYWVPGAWVYPPYVGALWTPGYWGWFGNHYRFRHGYWGPHVGFYGGINYGFGYVGYGYQGGYWNNNHFYYNRAVNRVSPVRVNNYVYVRNITVNRTYINNTRVAYYGGRGGLTRAPLPPERAAFREQHVRPMTAQLQTRQQAMTNRNAFFQANRGRPQEAAIPRGLMADRGFQRPMVNQPNGPRPFIQPAQPMRQGFGQNGAVAPRPEFRGNPGNPQVLQQQRQQNPEQQRRPAFQQQRQWNGQQGLDQRGQPMGQRQQQMVIQQQQRQAPEQQRQVQEQQRAQQMEQQRQQDVARQQQRQQMEQQRRDVLRNNQMNEERNNQQRQQAMEQRQQAMEQRQQAMEQRQQAMEQRQQMQNQRMEQQRQQDAVRQQQQRQAMEQQRQAQNQQRQQQMMQQRQMQQQPHMEQRPPMQPMRPPMQAPHPGGGHPEGGHGRGH